MGVTYRAYGEKESGVVTPFDLSRLCYPMLDQFCKALYISAGQITVQIQGRDTALPHMELDDGPYQKTVRFNDMLQQMQKAACTPQEPEL